MTKKQSGTDAPKGIEFADSPLFSLGQLVVTNAALALLDSAGLNASDVLAMHQAGAWRDFHVGGPHSDELAIGLGLRLFSAYQLRATKERLWVITDPDRQTTTLLIPAEFVRGN